MLRWRTALIAFATHTLACGASGSSAPPDAGVRDEQALPDAAPSGCIDADGDGAGAGADCAGADCDDTDPLTRDECGTGCEQRPQRRGCGCAPGAAPMICYHGRPEDAGVGRCRPGIQSCVDGVLGSCDGQVLPRAEQCDEEDDDCDGVVDDGVGGECGGCGDCASLCFGSAAGCSTWGSGRLDHSRSKDTGLTLDSPPTDEERVVWPGEDFPPVVFKVGALSHQIRGAYYTSHEADTLIESTRVNREGDLVVVNQVGSWITRIAAREADCPDRNGNGVVDTSQGWEDLLAFDDERQWDDECILWETRLPERGKAVTLHETYGLDALVETAWVGIDDREGADLDSGFWELDARTGEPTGRVLSTPGFGPRRTASDDRGWIWAVAGTNVIAEFNPEHPELGLELHEPDSPSLLSITVDEEGFPWVSSLGPARFDPAAGELAEVYQDWQRDQGLVPTAAGFMAPDGRGAIWHVTPEFGDPFRADIATLQWDRFPVGSERGLSNVGVDLLGQLWVLGGGSPSGWVLDLDAEDAEPTPVLDECRPRCMGSAANGEFTGLPWALLQPQRGVWTDDLVACDEAEEVQWTKVRASADVPRGSRITLFVRTGVDDQALWQGAWIRAGELVDGESDLPLDPALGRDTREHRFFAVQARLEADRDAMAPTLDSVQVLWGCQRPAE